MSSGELLVEFWCGGRPYPKGSYTPIVLCVPHGDKACAVCTLKSGGMRALLSSTEGLVRWQRDMAIAASDAYRRGDWTRLPELGPVRVDADFRYERTASSTTPYPTTRRHGDKDKLERALFDALTKARVYGDDSQVVGGAVEKSWAVADQPAGVLCRVWRVLA
jgi:hypothetical protein